MINFFDRFDKAFCISLTTRQDRRDNFLEQVDKYNLGNFDFFDAINGKDINIEEFSKEFPEGTFWWLKNHYTNGAVGLIKTSIQLFKTCIENNYSQILLMEDDCVFTEEINNIQSYIDLVPENWDMLYFGGNHYGTNSLHTVNEKIVRLSMSHMAHCIAIKSHMFKVILERLEKFDRECDVVYADLQKEYVVYCVYPSIAKQKGGHSDIQGYHTDFEWC
jgi:GR25 family glycosyltransferase involved in LPS biosynthesis